MQSEAVFLILSNLTGLSLHALAANRDTDSEVSDGEPSTANKSKPNDKAGGSQSREGGLEILSSSGASDGEEDKKTKPRKKRRRLNSRSSEGGKSSHCSGSDLENTGHSGNFKK